MGKLEIWYDESCEHCKESFKIMASIEKRHERCYSGMHSNRVILVPDYNAEGHMTHYHIEAFEDAHDIVAAMQKIMKKANKI